MEGEERRRECRNRSEERGRKKDMCTCVSILSSFGCVCPSSPAWLGGSFHLGGTCACAAGTWGTRRASGLRCTAVRLPTDAPTEYRFDAAALRGKRSVPMRTALRPVDTMKLQDRGGA